MQRLCSLERRLSNQQSTYKNYRKFMKEFSELDHMERISKLEKVPSIVCYLLNHAIIRESSTTTKLRVVFGASVKPGMFLDDILIIVSNIT